MKTLVVFLWTVVHFIVFHFCYDLVALPDIDYNHLGFALAGLWCILGGVTNFGLEIYHYFKNQTRNP